MVTAALSSGRLPYDNNGVYFVLSSSGIKQTWGSDGFCTTFCGWHDSFSTNGYMIKYAYIGWSGDCSGCKHLFSR